MSGLDGELIVDDADCLRVVRGSSDIVSVWPYGYALGTKDGENYVLGGELAVRVGDVIDVGGLDLGTSYGGPLVANREGGQIEGEQARQELYERCPGSYWLAGREVIRSDG